MPVKSPEAIARKKQRRNERNREGARRAAVAVPIVSTNRKWRIGPPMPEMTKTQLRAMLAQIFQNTAAL